MFSQRTSWKLAPNRQSQAIESARKRGIRLLDLTASNPTRCNFDFDSTAILNSLAHPESLDYDPQPQGLLAARQSVADYYAELPFARKQIAPGQIFLTTSTSEAYSFLFRLLCDPGDEVLIPRPSYPLFELLADIQDVQLRPYDLFYDHGWHIDVAGLSNAAGSRTRAVLLVNPNNPTGSFAHANELRQIANWCKQRQIAVISDEVFLDYALEKPPELSLAFEEECLSFALSGLSKISCLPQMKLAWIVVNGPEELRRTAIGRLEIIADTYLSVNAPIQHALPTLLGQREHIQRQLIARIRENLETLDDLLRKNSALERLLIEGGWYAVLRVPVTKSDEELAIELIERAGLVVHPGHFYDFPQDGFLIVSLITPQAEFREGIERFVESF
jgi:aspartate/methionine/tyrosine aminotransferase